jgi:hypothetical protein
LSWNNYGNNENSDRTTTTTRIFIGSGGGSGSNNNNQGARTTTSRSIINNQQGQGSGSGNNQKKTNNDNVHFENSDTGFFSQNNYPTTVTYRPLDQRRTTTQSSVTNRPTSINTHTTIKENYFSGDLPFFNRESTVISCKPVKNKCDILFIFRHIPF